jgi:hypothetical protein
MTDDLVKRLRADNDKSFVETLCGEAADRIEALTAERDQWIQHAKNAVWADSEEVKLLTADNARLRKVLECLLIEYDYAELAHAEPPSLTAAVFSARDALNTGKEPSHE